MWLLHSLVSVLVVVVFDMALGEIPAHRITNLPGYDGDLLDKHRQWSGYIEVDMADLLNTTAHVHYWLIEASEPDAPFVVWMQGGPGGSSMIGLFTENGPFTLNDFSFPHMKVFENPYSWHNMPAHMLYVEHPAPTGFSFCDPNPCNWTDETAAVAGYRFLENFFQAYDDFADKKFVMTGESYAGVLVPTISKLILNQRTQANRRKAPWSLQAIALGNACPGNRVFTCTPYSGWVGTKVAVDFRYHHGMISEALYEELQHVCENDWETFEAPKKKECRDLLEDPINPCLSQAGSTFTMGGGYYIYDHCGEDLGIDSLTQVRKKVEDIKSMEVAVRRQLLAKDRPPSPNSGEYFCGQERGSLIYLNKPEVQDALHVRRTDFQFQTELNYSFTAHSLLKLYNDTLAQNLDILQYSGDADPCVPMQGTQRWIRSLRLPTKKPWMPWISPHRTNEPAGYVHVMEPHEKNGKLFIFATVKDAGHMLPRYRPQAALHMIRSFVNKKTL